MKINQNVVEFLITKIFPNRSIFDSLTKMQRNEQMKDPTKQLLCIQTGWMECVQFGHSFVFQGLIIIAFFWCNFITLNAFN